MTKNINILAPYIRFFNASPHGGSLDFYIGNRLKASGVGFGTMTSYFKTDTNPILYRITRAGFKDDIVCETTICQKTGEAGCLAVAKTADNPELLQFNETVEKINPEYGHIRICNLMPQNMSLDIYAGKSMILSDIKFKEISKYMEIHPGSYNFSVFRDKNSVLNCGNLTICKGKFNTLYIIGLTDEMPEPGFVFSTDVSSYNGFYL